MNEIQFNKEKDKILDEISKMELPIHVKAALYTSKTKNLKKKVNKPLKVQQHLSLDICNKDGLYITAHIKDNKLDIEYYDPAGLYGCYERHLTLTEEATQKLYDMYQCNGHKILSKLKELFPKETSTEYFQNFCDKHNLKYETFTFID